MNFINYLYDMYTGDCNRNTLLTREEAEEILMLYENTLDQWESDNRFNLSPVRETGVIKYRHGDILDFIESQK